MLSSSLSIPNSTHRYCWASAAVTPALFFFVLIVGLSIAARGAECFEPLKMRLGLASTPAPALPNSVLWLAKDLGFYKREGLEMELIELRGTPTVLMAMRTGDIDVGNISTADVIRLTASKTLNLVAIHSPDARLYFLTAASSDVKSVADLKGKTFGIARTGSIDHSLSMNVLRSMGLKSEDLKLVAIGSPSTRAQALLAGRITATTISVPTWMMIHKEKGVRVLIDAQDYFAAVPIIAKVNAVTTREFKEKPEHLRRFTTAVIKASRYFAENQPAWVDAILKRRPELNRDDLAGIWKTFKGAWAVNGLMNMDLYRKTADFYYQTEEFKELPKIETRDWASTQYLDQVLKEIGIYGK